MIDLHYDLLTKLYVSYLENDFTYINEFIKNYNIDNVTGVIANMCFMSEKEMKLEYNENYYRKDVSVIKMFQIASDLMDLLLPSNIEVIKSIEGCDYIDIKDLDILYELGLRAILPVWNEKNRYGSGYRTDSGLTKEGEKLILHAIELGIAIDLSHANKNTFDGIINTVKIAQEKGFNPIIYASHSNIYNLCDRVRNLTDEQLLKIKDIDGIVGLFSNKNFVYKDSSIDINDNEKYISKYLEHIKYLESLFGGIDNIALSTDDMTFCADKDIEYASLPIFNYSTIKNDLYKLLKQIYTDEQVNKIMYGNAKKIFNKINNKVKKYN